MDEKDASVADIDVEQLAAAPANTRAVAFGLDAPQPDVHDASEKRRGGGVEVKRTMTQEDKELAAAGYEHLKDGFAVKDVKGGPGEGEKQVDITEHAIPIAMLGTQLDTDFDPKEPGSSLGLTENEAKERLARDGKNVLTPPKRKSALRKVRLRVGCSEPPIPNSYILPSVCRSALDNVQHPPHSRWYSRVHSTGNRF